METKELTERYKSHPITGKPMYVKNKPEAVARRNKERCYINGEYVPQTSKWYVKGGGRFNSLSDAWSNTDIKHKSKHSVGYVYAIVCESHPGWVKIGQAVKPTDRLGNYQTSSPHRDYSILNTINVTNMDISETKLHNIFEQVADERRGEWFKINNVLSMELFSDYENKLNVA